MQSVANKMLMRIRVRGRGWAFTKVDFVGQFSEASIHRALSTLSESGAIRRVSHGVYDYPLVSKKLGRQLGPDIDQVACALARKFGWRIQASGDAALNLLGLSNQVPGRWVYLTDGPSRDYDVLGTVLSFRRTPLKEFGFKEPLSGLFVQAIKALGPERVDRGVIKRLSSRLAPESRPRLLRETRQVAGWIYQVIKDLCAEGSP